MTLTMRKMKAYGIAVGAILLLTACGGEKRVDGEMAFEPSSLMTMAESFLAAGDYSNAMRLYQRAANENPRHVPSRLGLAQSYQAIGAADEAIDFYNQVLILDPANQTAKMGMAQMLITKNKPREALEKLQAIMGQDPENHRIYNMMGLAHDLMGQQEKAQMNYGKGLIIAPNNVSLLNNLALSFAFEDQYAPSLKLLSKAVHLDYKQEKARQNLVLVYVLSGEEEAGRKIGTPIMMPEILEQNITHYHWIKSLKPGQRAQAVFLGIKTFPEEISKNKNPTKEALPDAIYSDPKKQALRDMLKQQEGQPKRSAPEPITVAPSRSAPLPSTTASMPLQAPVPVQPSVAGVSAAEKPAPGTPLYRSQLGSYPTMALAYRGWAALLSRSDGLLESYKPRIIPVTLADGRGLFRLFVAEITDKKAARSLCRALRTHAVDCLVLKTEK